MYNLKLYAELQSCAHMGVTSRNMDRFFPVVLVHNICRCTDARLLYRNYVAVHKLHKCAQTT